MYYDVKTTGGLTDPAGQMTCLSPVYKWKREKIYKWKKERVSLL